MQVLAMKSKSDRRVLNCWHPVVALLALAVVVPAQTVQPNAADQTAHASAVSFSIKPYHYIDGRLLLEVPPKRSPVSRSQ